VTVTPPVELTPCNYHPDCCWWGLEVFPKSFFVANDFSAGRDYIVVQSQSGANTLQCDCDGNASSVQSIDTSSASTQNYFFVPEQIGGKIVALRSIHGGYLSIHSDGSVDCKSRTICEDNYIQVILSSNTCAQDAPNYVLLRGANGFYLSVSAAAVSSAASYSDASFLFKGYLWNESNSACNVVVPPVTSTPPVTPTPNTPTQQCHEVEVTVPKKKKHHKKKAAPKEEEDIITTTVHRKKVKHHKKKHVEQCDDDSDHDDSDYCEEDSSKHKKKSKKHKKNAKKNKVNADDVYDSNDVYYVDHNKDQKCDASNDNSADIDNAQSYEIADDSKDCL